MLSKLSSLARSGLLCLGVIGGLSVAAAAAPAGMANGPAPDSAGNLIRVQGDGRYGDCMRGGDCWRPGLRRGPVYRGGGPVYREGRGHRRDWNRRSDDDSWRYRRHDRNYRRHYHRDRYRPSIYFNFGIPSYSYYDPPYYYDYRPRYYQRRVYRSGRLSGAHVEWCYNRYRSYRAWDNTYQPYNGPRRQCVSPYS